ncbi:hypothetical protein COLO4_03141 [Corchorus olitorius]|uniref:Uncharacterized protein n=1 Tax=Corchorus olitorius TaxID=93759 RepID=A0A1R3KZJ7_9ROSI|nr:hypothetical protein COLO4_03141 [Corchorus olitorius]
MYPPRVEAPKQSRQKEESQAIPERTEPLLTKRKMRALMTTCSRQSYFIRLTDEDRFLQSRDEILSHSRSLACVEVKGLSFLLQGMSQSMSSLKSLFEGLFFH